MPVNGGCEGAPNQRSAGGVLALPVARPREVVCSEDTQAEVAAPKRRRCSIDDENVSSDFEEESEPEDVFTGFNEDAELPEAPVEEESAVAVAVAVAASPPGGANKRRHRGAFAVPVLSERVLALRARVLAKGA